MRAFVQRVGSARCIVKGHTTGEIGTGLVVLLGAGHHDHPKDAQWLARKISELRVFSDADGKMNLDLRAVDGAALVVPQFTLYGDVRRGRRPDFVQAAKPEKAEPLFDCFCDALAEAGIRVERGVFRAHMRIELSNEGPVSLWIESPGEEQR